MDLFEQNRKFVTASYDQRVGVGKLGDQRIEMVHYFEEDSEINDVASVYSKVYAAADSKRVFVYDVVKVKKVKSLKKHNFMVLCVESKRNNSSMLFSGDDGGRVNVRDCRTDRCLYQIEIKGEGAYCLKYLVDKSHLMVGGSAGTLYLYDFRKIGRGKNGHIYLRSRHVGSHEKHIWRIEPFENSSSPSYAGPTDFETTSTDSTEDILENTLFMTCGYDKKLCEFRLGKMDSTISSEFGGIGPYHFYYTKKRQQKLDKKKRKKMKQRLKRLQMKKKKKKDAKPKSVKSSEENSTVQQISSDSSDSYADDVDFGVTRRNQIQYCGAVFGLCCLGRKNDRERMREIAERDNIERFDFVLAILHHNVRRGEKYVSATWNVKQFEIRMFSGVCCGTPSSIGSSIGSVCSSISEVGSVEIESFFPIITPPSSLESADGDDHQGYFHMKEGVKYFSIVVSNFFLEL